MEKKEIRTIHENAKVSEHRRTHSGARTED